MGSGHHEVGAVSPAMADDLADVPLPPQPNVHRTAEAAELAGLLAAQRCVLIIGPPGTGKTSLAADAARQQAGAGPPDPCRYPALIYVDRPIPANRQGP